MRILVVACVFAACSMAQQPGTVWVKAIGGSYDRFKTFLNETAQVMPEADYNYRLTPIQRPFGEWIEHTAQLAYNACANIKGVPPPPEAKTVTTLTGKAAIAQGLADAFTYCDAAIKEMDDEKATREIAIGDRKVVPAVVMVNLVASLNEHYGNLVGYMRTKGITPPSTARAQQQKKK